MPDLIVMHGFGIIKADFSLVDSLFSLVDCRYN